MKRVLVTGAAGFIGSHLTEELVKQDYSVKVLVHYNSRNDWGNLELLPKEIKDSIEVLNGNIVDPFFCNYAASNVDVIFHLAALIAIPYSYIAPANYVDVNVKGTLNMLEAAKNNNVIKFLHTSTSETYGTAIYTPIDEKHPMQGQSPYSASKIGADKIAESYFRSFNLPVTTIRPFNNYGPRQSARAVIPTIISQALASKDKTIKLGSLSPVRDLLFVKDTVKGFISAALTENINGEVINLGQGKGITIGELAEKIINKLDPDIEILTDESRIRPEKSEVMKLICNNEKAYKLLNWKPKYDLTAGLEETILFIQNNLNIYKSGIYNV